MTTTTRTERRKADRLWMAAELRQRLAACGATIEDDPYPTDDPRTVAFLVRAGGAHARVEFSGDSWQPDVYVIPWCIDRGAALRFDPSCPGFQEANPVHGHKCTKVYYGWDELRDQLEGDVRDLLDGLATLPETPTHA